MCTGKNIDKTDDILAKSDGTSLFEHINDITNIYSQLRQLFPKMPQITGLANFWDLLFCALYFHDFGKIHTQFQKSLRGKSHNWEAQRHEVYSVVFAEKLKLDKQHSDLIKKAILGHHKSFEELKKRLISKEDLQFEYNTEWKDKLKYHPKDFKENLKHEFPGEILNNYLKSFHDLKKKYNISINLIDKKIKIDELENPIKLYTDFSCEFPTENYFSNLMLWAGLKICDHLGSAKIREIHYMKNNYFDFLQKLEGNLYKHQEVAFSSNDSAILIAPTGSGKTEAALGWLKNVINKNQGRVFYVLPYTASINAMYKRLKKSMEKKDDFSEIIGLIHGNLYSYISDYFIAENNKDSNIKKNEKIKKLVELYRNLIAPLIITTPFQLLKYFYGIKGFEKGLFFLSGAKLIFDEIHAYDIKTFAQIVVMLKFLKKYLHCDIFIMTATLPAFMIEILKEELEIQNMIYADDKTLELLKRHKIILKDGDVFSTIENILDKKDKKYIIVSNTVFNAQKVYQKILEMNLFKKEEIVLLHGRFNQYDRNKKEKILENDNTKVLIGTQTIEVSLDIDYDLMITEPAPIDALIQRFGRVNRKAEKDVCPIYICRKGGEYDKYIYPPEKIEKTLKVFEDIDEVNEKQIQKLLDEVYSKWTEKEQELFNNTFNLFSNSLKSLMPYSFSKEGEKDFYSRFTDVKVLPIKFYESYRELLEKYAFIDAEKLMVSINRNLFYRYLKKGLIEKREIFIGKKNVKNIYVVNLKYDERIGLTDEEETQKAFIW